MKAPIGWTNTLLHHVAEVRTGLSKSAKREGPSLRMPYLRVANVQDGYLDLTEIKEIDVPAKQVDRFTLKRGDILLIEGNGNPENLGRGCMWDGQVTACVHQNHIFAVRIPAGVDLTPQFLMLQLQSDYGRNYLLSCAKGSTGLSTLNSEQLRQLPVLLPPVTEQKKITKLLESWTDAIEKTEQLIAAKARAKDAYGIFLLAAKHPDFIRADGLFTPVSEKGRDDLQILSVTQDQGVIPRGMLDKQILMEASSVSTFKVVREGDFVISLRSFQGGLEYSPYEGVVSPAYTVLRPREDVYPEFFRHYLKSKDFLQRLSVAVIGIRDGKQINFSDFASIRLPVPPRDAQVKYAKFFDAMEREVILLRMQKDSLQKQKRGLMQKLLTGQWRVKLDKLETR